MSEKIKNSIILIVLFTLIIVIYVFFFKKDTNEQALVSQSAAPQGQESGLVGEFLVLLRTLNNIQLDTGIFNNKTYRSLRDESVELISQPQGRVNPFAPL